MSSAAFYDRDDDKSVDENSVGGVICEQPRRSTEFHEKNVPRANVDDKQVLCCSPVPTKDYQMDMCPPSWFGYPFHEPPADYEPPVGKLSKFLKCSWRLCFSLSCLPTCYCCYLTRTARRLEKKPAVSADIGGGETAKSVMNETMRLQIANLSHRLGEGQDNPVLKVNVVVLRSSVSHLIVGCCRGVLNQGTKTDTSLTEEDCESSPFICDKNDNSTVSSSHLFNDLGCQIAFSMFDEDEWSDTDKTNVNLVVLAVRKNFANDVSRIADLQSPLANYVAKFWRGFFPLLFVEVECEDDDKSSISQPTALAEIADNARRLFGEVLNVSVSESGLNSKSDGEFLNDCVVRLFVHSRLYQCSRFFGRDVIKAMADRCPGGCGLRNKNDELSNRTATKMKRKLAVRYRKLRA